MDDAGSVHEQPWGVSHQDKYGDKYLPLLMEQYRLYVNTATKVSDRRGTTQILLLTANTLFLAIYSMAAGTNGPAHYGPALWHILIPSAGLLVAISWYALIRSYRLLSTAKFRVIHAMENELPVRSFQMETHYLSTSQSARHIVLSKTEQIIPLVFGSIYIALAVSAFF